MPSSILRHPYVTSQAAIEFSIDQVRACLTGILLAPVIARHGIQSIRPISNKSCFSEGLSTLMNESVLWYEFKTSSGEWSSSIFIPSKLDQWLA